MKGPSLRHSLSAFLNAESQGGWGFIITWNLLGPIFLLVFLSIIGGDPGEAGHDLLAWVCFACGLLFLAATGARKMASVERGFYPFFLNLPLPPWHRIMLGSVEHLVYCLTWVVGPCVVFLLFQDDIHSIEALFTILMLSSAAVGVTCAWNEYFMTYPDVSGGRYYAAGGLLAALGWFLILKGMYDSKTAELPIVLPSGSFSLVLVLLLCGWALALIVPECRRKREGQHYKTIYMNPTLANVFVRVLDIFEKPKTGIQLLDLPDLTKNLIGKWRAFTICPIMISLQLLLAVLANTLFPEEKAQSGLSHNQSIILISVIFSQFSTNRDLQRLYLRFLQTLPFSTKEVVLNALVPLLVTFIMVFLALPWAGVENFGNRLVVAFASLNYGLGVLIFKTKPLLGNQCIETDDYENNRFAPLSLLNLIWAIMMLILISVSTVEQISGIFIPLWLVLTGWHLILFYWMWKRY